MSRPIGYPLLWLLCVLFLLVGCNNTTQQASMVAPEEKKPAASPPARNNTTQQASMIAPTPPSSRELLKTPFKDAISPVAYELPSGALATWRDLAIYKPTLVLFSTHPMLQPVPANRRSAIAELLRTGPAAEIVRRGQIAVADPAFFSPETVSIAIDQGYLSAIVLVLPTRKAKTEIHLDEIRQSAVAANFLTEKEGAALKLQDGVISGSVRGVPLKIAHPQALPAIVTPIVLHVDLSYFKELYVNEVKTPLYDLLFQTGVDIRDAAYPCLAVTLSYSNREIGYSLSSRFMIRDLAEILRNPGLLDGTSPAPASWSLRSAALYARAMFLDSRTRELTAQATQAQPPDPAAYFSLAEELLVNNYAAQGFAALDRAVALDKGYALMYDELASQGINASKREKAIELLDKAASLFPEDPFLRLKHVDLLIQSGRGKEALPYLDALAHISWSQQFHGDVPEHIKQMQRVAMEQPERPPAHPQPRPEPEKKPGKPKFNHMGMGIPGQ